MAIKWVAFIVAVLLCGTDAGFKRRRSSSPDEPPSKPSKTAPQFKFSFEPEPVAQSVFDRKLVSAVVTADDILKHHNKYHEDSHVKRFGGKTLGYVTPWNNHGYDAVKVFTDKFDYISPVWLQVKAVKDRSNEITFQLSGTHDIDQGWIAEVRSKAVMRPPPRFVPRLLFEHFSSDDWAAILSSSSLRLSLASLLSDCIMSNGFDGLVLEYYLEAVYQVKQISSSSRAQISLAAFTKQLLDVIHEKTANKELILVLTPWEELVSTEEVFEIAPHVDLFSVMTYDFSVQSRIVGPVSPIMWIEETIQRFSSDEQVLSKLLIGINFYGSLMVGNAGSELRNSPQAILGKQYLEVLKEEKPVVLWENRFKEQYVPLKKANAVIFFPSLESIQERLVLATKYGVGVAIWETGQGLEYFFDLF
jgi:chitinase domain-containing protein 1